MKHSSVSSYVLIVVALVGWDLPARLFAQGHVDITTTRLPAYLNGHNQVPPNQSSNVAVVSVAYVRSISPFSNTAVKCQIDLPISFSFEPAFAGIYGPATIGQNGNLMSPLGPFVRSTNVFQVITWPEPTYMTNISHSCTNTLSFSQQQIQLLESKQCYVSISSSEYPGGEIRGQITKSPVLGGALSESGGRLSFSVAGPMASNYRIETSTNLSDWSAVTNFATTTNFFTMTMTNLPSAPARWYRVAY